MESMFTLTPMMQTIKLEPGETYEGSVTIANPASSTADFSFKVSISPYGVSGTDYKADFITDANRTQMAKWIKADNPTGTIKPNSTEKITYTITVPENAPAGGQYAAIMVGSNNENSGGGGVSVNNVYEMASLIYAEVAGETVRKGEIVQNELPGFVLSLPIIASSTFKNEGNLHETAKVALEVKDAFTGNVIYPTGDDSGAVNEIIMPETTREFVREIDGLSPLGIFNVTQTISYMGENSTIQNTVIVCPIWFLALVTLTIVAIVFTIVKTVMKHRRKKVLV